MQSQPEITRELFHVQSNISFQLAPHLSVIRIGKPNDQNTPDIDVSSLPNADVVSRNHAEIRVQGSTYSIEDVGSSNGTYLNNTKLETRVRYSLNPGDKIDLGQGNKFTFIFQHKQNFVHPTNTPAATVPPSNTVNNSTNNSTATNIESQVLFISKLLGLVLMLAGLGFLTSSLVIGSAGFIYNTPLIALGTVGILILTYGGSNRRFGWVLIGIGVAIAIGSGGIFIVPITLFSFLLASGAFSAGYQLFTSGKIWNFNPLSLLEVMKK